MTGFRLKKDKPRVDVLIVDDDPGIQELLRALLEAEGLSHDLAVDGREAFRMAMEKDYSLILMDIKMPNWNGLDAIRSLEFCDEFTRVIVISGFLDDSLRKQIEKEPVVLEWFDKPFDSVRLGEVIREAVSR
jgi:DNA-binding NtrC family response regulator